MCQNSIPPRTCLQAKTLFTGSKDHSRKVCFLQSITFDLLLLSATNTDCYSMFKTSNLTFLRPLSVSSIINFFPSPLVNSNSRKAGYYSFTLLIQFTHTNRTCSSLLLFHLLLYLITLFNMVSNINNIKIYYQSI